jgi:hypothetical protein
MNRRLFLASLLTVGSLAGCLTDDDDSEPELLRKGTQIASVSVAGDAPGPVEVTAACRDEVYTVEAGEEFELLRQEDAESCTVQFRSQYAEPAETEYQIGRLEEVELTVHPDEEFDFSLTIVN